MRFKANQEPFNSPCFCNASAAYSEQVGANLHAPGSMGEIMYLYIFISSRGIKTNALRMVLFGFAYLLIRY